MRSKSRPDKATSKFKHLTSLFGVSVEGHRVGVTGAQWVAVRVSICAVAAIVIACVLSMRPPYVSGTWASHLSQHGLVQVQNAIWLTTPEPGMWGVGLVEAVAVKSDAAGVAEAEDEQGKRDVFIFGGLVTGEGEPFSVRRVGNITRTADGDDVLLAVGHVDGAGFAAVGTQVSGSFVGLDLFHLDGDRRLKIDELGEPRSVGDQLRISLIHLQDNGRWSGVGRRSYAFESPVDRLEVKEDSGLLKMAGVISGANASRSVLRIADGEILELKQGTSLGLIEQTEPWALGSWIPFIVNRVRALSWVGPGKIAALEKVVFNSADVVRTFYYSIVGQNYDDLERDLESAAEAQTVKVVPSITLAAAEGSINVSGTRDWPPQDITPKSHEGLKKIPNEGKWAPWVPEWHKDPVGEDWPYYRTALRVNPKRAHDYIVLVALDLRKLNFNMAAGTSNPTTTTGTRGKGRILDDPSLFERELVVFNGGFKTDHGAYGMMVNRRTIIPAKAAAATVGINDNGQVMMGSWGAHKPPEAFKHPFQAMTVKNAFPVPHDVKSFRQNLPPLVANGKINPVGLRRWGGVVDYLSSATTPRSSICLKGDSTLMYIWGSATSADELGEAHLMAGCDYGIHLDMNPIHSSFIMHKVELIDGEFPPKDKKTGYKGALYEAAASRMITDWYRYLRTSVKDFFYLTRRTTFTERLGASQSDVWSSRGLPVSSGGLEPMALRRKEDGVTLLGLDVDTFKASVVEGGGFDADSGVKGELHVGVMLDDVKTPWLSDVNKMPSFVGLNVSAEGHLSLVDGSENAVPTPAHLLPGKPLIIAGKQSTLLQDDDLLGDPVVVAKNEHGDLILGVCVRCSVQVLLTSLTPLKPTSALLFGVGGLYATTFPGQGEWIAALPHASPDTESMRLKLIPVRPPPRAFLSDFKSAPPEGSSQLKNP